ncbi:MAG: 30S ribosome-binding factor RbfA [bacterium]
MESFKRTDRIGELIREEISSILREDVKDPRLGMLSVTKVRVTPDLRHAHIYISPFKKEDVEDILKCLKNARGFIQKRFAGRKIKLRYTPVLEFHIDDSIKYGAHIMEILEDIKKEQGKTEK